ncbi:PC4/YdbC family ssDNA-binding protein [Clostridium algifaecis]|uniref:PC4/YdbC family ssDNA-binding protein n=1 Tax=Clostridium algifaecis TaxID=1472040 RepID=UPI001AE4B556|nr:PC4/YdbC family ssDNA-binding protein [Clostridium algifaecis]
MIIKEYNIKRTLISWNDKEPKYNIRYWDSEHKKTNKGVTLSVEELKTFKDAFNGFVVTKV